MGKYLLSSHGKVDTPSSSNCLHKWGEFISELVLISYGLEFSQNKSLKQSQR